MELNDFKNALHIGLGRTILHLQENDSTKYRDIILHACLYNTTHDQFSEGDKSKYMMDIINLTNEQDYYISHIKNTAKDIDDNTNDEDAFHLLDMLSYLIRDGDKEAKIILFELFLRTRQSKKIRGGKHLVWLYGLKGFRFVATRLGEIALSSPDFTDDEWHVLRFVPDRVDPEKIVNKLRQDDERIDAYMKVVESNKQERQQLGKSLQTLSYTEFKERIFKTNNREVSIRNWAINASATDIGHAARDFENTTDEFMLEILTRIFRECDFPLAPELLFKHVEHPVAYIRARVFSLLGRIDDDSIRDFAKILIQKKRHIGNAVLLLSRKSTDPNWDLISSVLEYDLSSDDYHNLQLTVNSLPNIPPTEQIKDILLHLYEYGSCSFCREGIVTKTNDISGLTDAVKFECYQDSFLAIRDFATTNF